MQIHRYAAAGPLSLCPVVVMKVYTATLIQILICCTGGCILNV